MSKAGERLIEGLTEAVAVAKGEAEPASIRYLGHTFPRSIWATARVLMQEYGERSEDVRRQTSITHAWGMEDDLHAIAIAEAILAERRAERRRCAKIANDKADELYAKAGKALASHVGSLADQGLLARSIASAISIGEGE